MGKAGLVRGRVPSVLPAGKEVTAIKEKWHPEPESRSHLPSSPVHSVYPALPPAFSGAARPPALRRFWV